MAMGMGMGMGRETSTDEDDWWMRITADMYAKLAKTTARLFKEFRKAVSAQQS